VDRPLEPPGQPSSPRQRPWQVTAVVWTQYLTAVALVLAAVGLLAVQASVQVEAERLMHRDLTGDFGLAASEIDWAVQGSFGSVAVFYLILAAAYVVMAALNAKGIEAGRILSWVMSGFALACVFPAGLFTRVNHDFFAHRSLLPQDSGGMDYSNNANEWIIEATPGWVTALDWIAVLMVFGCALHIIELLRGPAARWYFGRP
jgi:hypothetical protein